MWRGKRKRIKGIRGTLQGDVKADRRQNNRSVHRERNKEGNRRFRIKACRRNYKIYAEGRGRVRRIRANDR